MQRGNDRQDLQARGLDCLPRALVDPCQTAAGAESAPVRPLARLRSTRMAGRPLISSSQRADHFERVAVSVPQAFIRLAPVGSLTATARVLVKPPSPPPSVTVR